MAILITNNGNHVVETIADRNGIEKRHMGMTVFVKDATADVRFGGGLVNYIWDSTALDWLPTYSSYKSDVKFSTESKIIIGGEVTTSYVVKDGMVWSAKILDADGLIVADAQVVASGDKIQLPSGNWDGYTLYYTYAHGTMTTELYGIWESKADLASPEFTGTPTVPTAAAGTESEQIANTAFVSEALKSVGFEKQADGEGWKSNVKTDTYTVTVEPPSEVSGGEIDLDSQQVVVFNGTINQNITLTNPPGADRAMTMVIKFKGKGGTITWPNDILWADDKVPELSDTFTIVVLMWDGEEWIGSAGMKR